MLESEEKESRGWIYKELTFDFDKKPEEEECEQIEFNLEGIL